jgi:hypothetical protein
LHEFKEITTGSEKSVTCRILIDFGRVPGMIPIPYYASHDFCSG